MTAGQSFSKLSGTGLWPPEGAFSVNPRIPGGCRAASSRELLVAVPCQSIHSNSVTLPLAMS
jgi:hypothetical protein